MILLDTHIWVWYVTRSPDLKNDYKDVLSQADALSVSLISCWEVAKLVEVGRLTLDRPVLAWIRAALRAPQIHVLDLTPEILVASTQLPGTFHKDPANQIIVATARIYGIPLLTLDAKILAYEHVETSSGAR